MPELWLISYQPVSCVYPTQEDLNLLLCYQLIQQSSCPQREPLHLQYPPPHFLRSARVPHRKWIEIREEILHSPEERVSFVGWKMDKQWTVHHSRPSFPIHFFRTNANSKPPHCESPHVHRCPCDNHRSTWRVEKFLTNQLTIQIKGLSSQYMYNKIMRRAEYGGKIKSS